MQHSSKKAFTLIEIIVIIAVLAVLAILAVPRLMGYTKRATQTRLSVDAKLLTDASQRYYLANGDWPRASDTPYTADQVTAFSAKVYDVTGAVVTLDPAGNYYDIDVTKLSPYITLRESSQNFVLQNPVGAIYVLDAASNERLSSQPTAVIRMTPNTGITTETPITWDASNSSDPAGGHIIDTQWTGKQDIYTTPGIYKVTLRVENSNGVWSDPATVTFNVSLPATKPVAVIGMTPNQGITTRTTITWDTSGSYDTNTGGTIIATQWTGQQTTYATAGTYTVTLTVENDKGLWSDPTTVTFSVVDATLVKQVAVGAYHTVILLTDGTVKIWGRNQYGQIGNGTTTNQLTPITVAGLSNVKAVAAGYNFTLALLNDGTLMAWGQNTYGQLGIGSTVQQNTPVAVPGLTGVSQVSAGANHAMTIMSDGTVRTWGYNNYGQLGLGDTTQRNSPTAVPGLSGITQIVGGNAHTVALLSNGTLKAWGYNVYGQLGTGNTTTPYSPVAVSGLSGVQQIVAGDTHTLALLTDGTVRAWGYNGYGQLGLGNTTNQLSPMQVPGIVNAKQVSAGIFHSAALLSDGTGLAWGYNANGQMGNGTTTQQNSPGTIPGLASVARLIAGGYHNAALLADSATVKTWGYNAYGQMGIGNTTNQLSPVTVSVLP